MGQNIWKKAFEQLELDDRMRQQVWEQIVQTQKLRQNGVEKGAKRKELRMRWAVITVMCSLILGIVIINVKTEGKFVEVLQSIWKEERHSQEIVEQTVSYRFDTLDAPDIVECSEKRLIFASTMGLIVYDRKQKRVEGTIDLKKIGCFYMEDGSIKTRVLPEGDQLIIYNYESGRKEQGDCYIFDLAKCRSVKQGDVEALEPQKIVPVTVSVEEKWQRKVKKSRKKTVEDNIFGEELNKIVKRKEMFFYSRHSLAWRDGKGEQYLSCLIASAVKGNTVQSQKDEYRFCLYSKNVETGEIEKETLKLNVYMPENKYEPLPAYECRTDNLIRKALAACAANDLALYHGTYYGVGKTINWDDYYPNDMPVLPIINIYKVKEGKKYTKVFGAFTTLGLVRYGDILCETNRSDTSGYGCAYLKKTTDGYIVEKIVHPRDGAYLLADMTAMCDGDEKLSAKLHKWHDKWWKIRQKEVIKTVEDYVAVNGLDIQYFKGDGANLVELKGAESE